jgi:hypothetical protein
MKSLLMLPIMAVIFGSASVVAAPLSTTATLTLTSDNHYAAYLVRSGTVFTNLGNNELGPGGSPGQYNWSLPESYSFNLLAGDRILIGAWNDSEVAQMVLGAIQFGSNTIYTDGAWRAATSQPVRTTGSQPPNIQEAQAALLLSFVAPYVGQPGQNPWGTVPGLAAATPIGAVPLVPADQVGLTKWFYSPELVPSGSNIPEPSTYMLAGLGLAGLAAIRRKAA